MAEVDAKVGLPQDGAGQQVAAKSISRDDGSTVLREEVVVADGSKPTASQTVSGERGRGKAWTVDDELVKEMRALRLVMEDLRELLMEKL